MRPVIADERGRSAVRIDALFELAQLLADVAEQSPHVDQFVVAGWSSRRRGIDRPLVLRCRLELA